MNAAHISEAVKSALTADGWQEREGEFSKRIAGIAMPGTCSPDGARIVTLRLDPAGRWLERFDQGLGRVERDCDLRQYEGRPRSAIAAVMEGARP
jgi:hypothetical protein